jgi:hypothetical protein
LSTEYKSYKRFFEESWRELEQQFRRGVVNPQQENDVVCYIYHEMAKRLRRKNWLLSYIRTEDTRNIKGEKLRADINLRDRLFVEVRMYELRKYGDKGWGSRKEGIAYHVKKLEKYIAEVRKSTPSIKERIPVLALWFWKREEKKRFPIKTKLIDDELEKKLAIEAERYKNRVTIMYGPRRQIKKKKK